MKTLSEVIASFTRDKTLREYLNEKSAQNIQGLQSSTAVSSAVNSAVPQVVDVQAMAQRIIDLEESLNKFQKGIEG